mgnify:CR=1 FL=1
MPARLHLVAAGIGRFNAHSRSAPLSLKYAASDAKRLVRQLKKQLGAGLQVYGGRALTDRTATRLTLLEQIDAAIEAAAGHPDDLVLIYLRSLGLVHDDGVYLLSTDFDPSDPWGSSVSQSDLEALMARHDARVVLVLETDKPASPVAAARPEKGTQKGSLALAPALTSSQTPPLRMSAVTAAVTAAPGQDRVRLLEPLAWGRQNTWVLLSSRGDRSLEGPRFCKGAGAFACLLLEGLSGRADIPESGEIDADNLITVEELAGFLERRLPDLVRQAGLEPSQVPAMLKYGGALTVGRRPLPR